MRQGITLTPRLQLGRASTATVASVSAWTSADAVEITEGRLFDWHYPALEGMRAASCA